MTKGSVDTNETATSPSLLDRVRAQDQSAWKQMIELYGPLVYSWCLRSGLQPADAADVGQEVFVSVSKAIGSFHEDRPDGSFRGWLYVITKNKLRDQLVVPPGSIGVGGSDAQLQVAKLPDQNAQPDCDANEHKAELNALRRRAIESMREDFEPRTWAMFMRCFADEVSVAEVAEEFGVTRNVVYLARSRVLKRLRQRYEGLIDFGFEAPNSPHR